MKAACANSMSHIPGCKTHNQVMMASRCPTPITTTCLRVLVTSLARPDCTLRYGCEHKYKP
jgi:hypothetical protein